MSWYARLVANHPYCVVLLIGTLSVTCLVVSLTSAKLPDFTDPQLGFESRGTELSQRLTAWENLLESTRPSGPLTANPKDYFIPPTLQPATTPLPSSNQLIPGNTPIIPLKLWGDKESAVWVSGSFNISQDLNDSSQLSESEVLEEEEWESLSKGPGRLHDHVHDHQHLSTDGFFCDGLSHEYSHVVLESTLPQFSLFSLDNLLSICELQSRMMSIHNMATICETVSHGRCCAPWSLPNYIALMHNRSSCFDLTEEDVLTTRLTLIDCARFYYNLQLPPDCHEILCPDLPAKCTRHNSVYNILYYLTDTGFLSGNITLSHHSTIHLRYTMIFLPIARSSAVLPYYYILSSLPLGRDNVRVSAIDFGLKNALFDDCLLRDAMLILLGAGFMILCMWCYTGSLFITLCTVLAIAASLIISYFIYTFLFRIQFFPFMNLLAVIVAVGIGADDVFIFCKVWQCSKAEKVNATVMKLVADTLRHAVVSMLVTSFTTAAAFYSNCVSSITAINCFSIFAGTAVLVNFLLMVTWLPACVVIAERWCCPPMVPSQWRPEINHRIRTATEHTNQLRALLDRLLLVSVVRMRWLWLLLFASLAVAGAVVVLYRPKLRLPDSNTFQLFSSRHLFERYDSAYRDQFKFELLEKSDHWDNSNARLPLRFVWGVLPVDNGDYLQPNSKGSLVYDPEFDISAPESQLWLLKLCRLVRTQPFYQSTLGPLLPNCFIESFRTWMQRRCKDSVDNIDRTPCCEVSRFPFPRRVFQLCIVEAIGHLYETPKEFFIPGVAGPKFSKKKRGEIKAIVIEYDSNHSYSLSYNDMHVFHGQVESWFRSQLASAPPGLRRGWFVSHLSFYDLQSALTDNTLMAIAVSMAVALVVVFAVTLNLLLSLYAVINITCIIFVTVACLVLLQWRLNVLESIAVTTAIGLAVDFSLHYTVAYRMSGEEGREPSVVFALSRMGGPTIMAALTTAAAGAFMLPSAVLAYIQIGVFLVVVMSVSWIYSTIFLMSLLSIAGPQRGCGQLSYSTLLQCCSPSTPAHPSPPSSDRTVFTTVLSETTLSTSSIPQQAAEAHELEALARGSRRARRPPGRSTRKDRSPSAASATTIVLVDELEVETRPRGEEPARH